MNAMLRFRLNGQAVTLQTEPDRLLLWVLRGELALTGAKYGCGAGICGACTVLLDGNPARACITTLREVDGHELITIEGLAHGTQLDPVQQAFVDHGALQCGYCTPGMILTAKAMLLADPHPSREAIAAGLEHNLCRCGAHRRILDAVESVARPPNART